MSVTDSERMTSQEVSDEGLEALGRTLQHAFPMSECRSFKGLMEAIGADRRAREKEGEPFLLNFD